MEDIWSWIVNHWDTLLAIVGALYGVVSAIVGLTPTPRDDEALGTVRRWLLRLSILRPGTLSLPGTLPVAPRDTGGARRDEIPPPPRVPGGLAVLLAAGLASGGMAGCGGVPHAARVAVEQTAGGVALADELLSEEIAYRGERARLEVMAEGFESVDEALARWDAKMAGTSAARTALRVTRSALLAVERSLDAWDAGADSESFLDDAACLVEALTYVLQSFEAADLDLPAEIAAAADLIRPYASGLCPTPVEEAS